MMERHKKREKNIQEAVFKERKKGAFVPSNDRAEYNPPQPLNPPALQVYEYLLLLLLTNVP